jgi:hypothetical protein
MTTALSADPTLDRLLHDLKQPLNLARVVAQDLRLDAQRGRLVVERLPESLRAIEAAVDEAVEHIEQLRALVQVRPSRSEP